MHIAVTYLKWSSDRGCVIPAQTQMLGNMLEGEATAMAERAMLLKVVEGFQVHREDGSIVKTVLPKKH